MAQIQNNLTYSTEKTYEEKILENESFISQKVSTDLNRQFKDHYIELLSPMITPEQKTNLLKACVEHSPQPTNYKMQLDRESTCFRGFYVLPNSGPRRIFDFMQFINLSYISHAIPLYVAFNVEIAGGFLFAEVLSTVFSVLVILINLRTPVTIKG